MKLWLLRPKEGRSHWEPWYDKAFGFVVRANSETEARKLASGDAGDEGEEAWLLQQLSTCVELTADGEAGIIMLDFHSA
jgi:hypothetical protein